MKLTLLQNLYKQKLSFLYSEEEIEAMFWVALLKVDCKTKTDFILDGFTENKTKHNHIIADLELSKPIQYILRETEFYGLPFVVDENVLIPRPETEELVNWINSDLNQKPYTILDIGTGSGCIAIAGKSLSNNYTITGSDIDSKALNIAKENSERLDLNVRFTVIDILSDNINYYDILVSNPPYIHRNEQSTMKSNVIDYEPHLALFVEDNDVLLFYKKIVNISIIQKNIVYFETSEHYKKDLSTWLESKNVNFTWRKDLMGKFRMLKIDNSR